MEPGTNVIDVGECLELLATKDVGRVAIDEPDGPFVVPVNYALDLGTVVFRTAEGTKLDAAIRRKRVSFEVDHVDEATREGWSVLVRGKAEEIVDPDELARVRSLPLEPLAGGDRHRYVRLLSSHITGRRLAM
jgi:nitroimidazol reductase NimA-like FMN-containing flavoprotein (pyridoxamine 5'-phosphate oxidase superfamily)